MAGRCSSSASALLLLLGVLFGCGTRTRHCNAAPPSRVESCHPHVTFENGTMGYREAKSRTSRPHWIRNRGRTLSDNTGPSVDHTTGKASGYYMYLEVSSGSVNDTASLASPSYPAPPGGFCKATFWYHMFGATVNTLNVYIKNSDSTLTRVWSKEGNQGDMWHQGQFSIPQTDTDYQLVFEGWKGNDFTGDIAIDDITFSDGCCPGRSIRSWTCCNSDVSYTIPFPNLWASGADYYRARRICANVLKTLPNSGTLDGPCLEKYTSYANSVRNVTGRGEVWSNMGGSPCAVFNGSQVISTNRSECSNGLRRVVCQTTHSVCSVPPIMFGGMWRTKDSDIRNCLHNKKYYLHKCSSGFSATGATTSSYCTGSAWKPPLLTCRPEVPEFYVSAKTTRTITFQFLPTEHHVERVCIQVTGFSTDFEWSKCTKRGGAVSVSLDPQERMTYNVTAYTVITFSYYGELRSQYSPSITLSTLPIGCRPVTTFERDWMGYRKEHSRTGRPYWDRINGSTFSLGTGPSVDHTFASVYGKYVFLETSGGGYGDTGRIISPSYPSPPGGFCKATFWYHMFGATVNTLNVYIKNNDSTLTRVWSKEGNQGDVWHEGQFSIPHTGSDFQLVFEGSRGDSYTGDIALDDINFNYDCCPDTHRQLEMEVVFRSTHANIEANISWSEVVSSRSPILDFTICHFQGNVSEFSIVQRYGASTIVPEGGEHSVISDLLEDTIYTFAIQARTKYGPSRGAILTRRSPVLAMTTSLITTVMPTTRTDVQIESGIVSPAYSPGAIAGTAIGCLLAGGALGCVLGALLLHKRHQKCVAGKTEEKVMDDFRHVTNTSTTEAGSGPRTGTHETVTLQGNVSSGHQSGNIVLTENTSYQQVTPSITLRIARPSVPDDVTNHQYEVMELAVGSTENN